MDSLRRGVHGLYRSFACPDAEDQPEPVERNDPAGSDRTTAAGIFALGQGRRCGHESSGEHPGPERRTASGCGPHLCGSGRELYHQR